jgi:erythromycin esterase-like protein
VEHLPRFAGSFNSRTMATCDLRAEMNDALADLFATKREASADERARMVQRQLARLVKAAEECYRTMHDGDASSRN